jgi:flagellar motility protein MotE (MotC chaperone)
MASSDRLQIMIDAQDKASRELKVVQKELSGVQKKVKATSKEFKKSSNGIQGSLKKL